MTRACSECPTTLPPGSDPRKLTCSRPCMNARRVRLKRLAKEARPLPGGRQRENFTRCTDLAELHGVTPSAIRSWLRTRRYSYVVHEKNIWINNRIAERYSSEREARFKNPLPERPNGWRSVKQLAGMMSISTETARATLHESTDIRYGSFGMTLYVHPDDAEVLRMRARSEDALPGWVALSDLAREFERRLSSLHIVADRLGIEMRFARRFGTRSARHVTPEGARALREWHATAPKRRYVSRPRERRGEARS